MNSERYNWIDWAKVICIYFVVIGHMLSTTSSTQLLVKNVIYSFHMPCFFFISGFLFRDISDNFLAYFKKCIYSFVIPYVFFNLLCYVLSLHNYGWINAHLIKETLLGGSHCYSGPCWFLLCLFFVRVYYFFLAKLKKWFQCGVLIICLATAYIIPIDLPWSIDAALLALPFYAIGKMIKDSDMLKYIKESYLLSLVLFIIFAVLLVWLTTIQGRVDLNTRVFGNYPILYFPTALIGIGMLVCFTMLLNKVHLRTIEQLSRGTIVIMALHGAVNEIFSGILGGGG